MTGRESSNLSTREPSGRALADFVEELERAEAAADQLRRGRRALVKLGVTLLLSGLAFGVALGAEPAGFISAVTTCLGGVCFLGAWAGTARIQRERDAAVHALEGALRPQLETRGSDPSRAKQ